LLGTGLKLGTKAPGTHIISDVGIETIQGGIYSHVVVVGLMK
jgi:hypothetical protein